MSGPSKNDRKTLGKRLKSREAWAEVFGWMVGGGLLIEYGKEIIDCFVNWHRPSLALLGGVVVTAAVFGEVLFSRLVVATSDEISRLADSDVAQAYRDAAEALESARKAEQAAAEANLARLTLEQRYAARRISAVTYDDMKKALAPHAGKRVDIFLFDGYLTEVRMLAEMVYAAFKVSDWRVGLWTVTSGEKMNDVGFTIATAAELRLGGEFRPIAQELAALLKRDGVSNCIAVGGFSSNGVFTVTGEQTWDPNDIAPLRIEIAEKPLVSTVDCFPHDFAGPVTAPQA